MKAVIYARFSCHNQQEQSIEGQLRDCYEYAKQNGMQVVGEYIDRALSAKTDNRADFQRMIKDSEKGLWEAVIVWKLDRFSRNRYDSAMYKSKLRKNGVSVISAKENISNTPEGILIESLLEGMAEYYSADLAEKVNRGMRETALKARFNGGAIPLGYKIVNKQYEIDEAAAPIVKKIFEMYADGVRKGEIIKYLNSKNFKNSRGGNFSYNSFNSMLKNKRYTGTYVFGDIEIPNAIPQIISNELFGKVQTMINHNKKQGSRHKAKTEYLLSTKLFCGHCKTMMAGESGTGRHGTTYNYYKCLKRKRNPGSCDKSSVKKDYIEDIVINAILKNILNDDVIERIADKIIELQKSDYENSIIFALEAKLKDTETALKNVMAAIESGIITKTTKNRLAELEEETENLKYEIRKEKCRLPVFEKNALIALLNTYKDGDKTDTNYRRHLINAFVYKVYLYDDKLLILYNYSNSDGSNEQSILDFVEKNDEASFSDTSSTGEPILKVSETIFVCKDFLCCLISL